MATSGPSHRPFCRVLWLALGGLLLLYAQVCPPIEAWWVVGVVAPLLAVAVAILPLDRHARMTASIVLAGQVAAQLACALHITAGSGSTAATCWHLALVAVSVLLIHLRGRALGAIVARAATRWPRRPARAAVPGLLDVAVLHSAGRLRGRRCLVRFSSRAPPVRVASATT